MKEIRTSSPYLAISLLNDWSFSGLGELTTNEASTTDLFSSYRFKEFFPNCRFTLSTICDNSTVPAFAVKLR